MRRRPRREPHNEQPNQYKPEQPRHQHKAHKSNPYDKHAAAEQPF